MGKLLIVPDEHGRSFFHKIFEEKELPVIFLGDYTCPYWHEGFTDIDCLNNLKRTIQYKMRRPKDVTLLIGNHCTSFIWSYMGFERTNYEYYKELHDIYRNNIKLFEPCKLIGNTLFTHAGISNNWLYNMNCRFKKEERNFELNEKTIIPYIENEYFLELQYDKVPNRHIGYSSLNSDIFNIGWSRGGGGYGGPFWSDFNDEFTNPDWNLWQIFGHTQAKQTGIIRQKGQSFCLDSRAVFEYDTDTHDIKLSELTENYEEVKANLINYEE